MKAQLEHVIPPGGYSIQAFGYQKDHFDAPWHVHRANELTYIVSSRGLRYVGNEVNPFCAGDFVLLAGNLPHCWKNEDNNRDISHAIVIQWESSLFSALPEFLPVNELLARSKRGIRFLPGAIKNLEEKLLSIIYAGPLGRYVQFLGLLDELGKTTACEYICSQAFDHEFNIKTNQRLEKIFDFLKANYQRKINLSEIAGLCNMTEESVSRFFSKALKKPFFSYLNEYRVNMACKMLQESGLPVSEIAYENGFGSLAFFHRQFLKYKKMPPARYQKLFAGDIV